MTVRLNYKQVGDWHNKYLQYLLDNFDRDSSPRDIAKGVVSAEIDGVSMADSYANPEFIVDLFSILIKSGRISTSIDDQGLPKKFMDKIKGFMVLARNPGISVDLSSEDEDASELELLVMGAFSSVANASLQFWSNYFEVPEADVYRSSLVIWTGSHTGIDVGVLMMADGAGVIGSLAGTGVYALWGAGPQAPVAAGAIAAALAAAAGAASFYAFVSGAADVTLPREPHVPAGTPDPGNAPLS